MITLKLARRYVFSRLVNYVAMLVVALVLTVQITVMGVLDGVVEDLKKRARGLGEQIVVNFEYARPLPTMAELEQAEAALKNAPAEAPHSDAVVGLTPLLRDYAVLERGDALAQKPLLVYGIDIERELRHSELWSHLEPKPDPTDPWLPENYNGPRLPGIYVGWQVAKELRFRPWSPDHPSYVVLNCWPRGSNERIRKRFVVTATVKSGNIIKDQWGVYVPLKEAQELMLGSDDTFPVISVWLEEPERADELQEPIVDAIAATLKRDRRRTWSMTWQQQWEHMVRAMEYENMLQEVVLAMMNLSAAFCIFAVLATLVSRRVRDVGLLRCLGASRGGVVRVFLLVGLIIGVKGSILGVAGGYAVGYNIDEIWTFFTGHPPYPPHLFEIEGMPVVIHAWKVALYVVAANLLAVLAALYPAAWAGLREPVEALRDE